MSVFTCENSVELRRNRATQCRAHTLHSYIFAGTPHHIMRGAAQADCIDGVSMSLQESAELGAAMSGIGVIASVIYVSIQISNNTRAVRAWALQQVIGLDFVAKSSSSTIRYGRNALRRCAPRSTSHGLFDHLVGGGE
jgi:hypothetical protein